MLNQLIKYCVPDLNSALFGIPTSDVHTNCRIIIIAQDTYWTLNGVMPKARTYTCTRVVPVNCGLLL